MRPIKFRGISLQTNQWVYGSLVQYGGKSYIFVPRMGEYDDFEVDPKTVGQLTGRRDKKRVDIYEGDILTNEEDDINEIVGAVVWHEEKTMWSIDHPLKNKRFFDRWAIPLGDTYYYLIGNIHQNHELLAP